MRKRTAKQERKDKRIIEFDFKESKKKDSRERNNNDENKDNQANNRSNINNQNNKTNTKQSRPKLIGRLATTIVGKYESVEENNLESSIRLASLDDSLAYEVAFGKE